MSASEPRPAPRPPAFRGHPYLLVGALLVGLVAVRAWRTEGLLEENLFNNWLFYACLVTGFWFVFGIAGHFAFSQAAFAGLGAYTAAWVTGNDHPFELAVVVAVLVCAAVSLAFGLLVRRAAHLYFAIATLGLSEVLLLVFHRWRGFTGGGEITNIAPISLLGWEVSGPDRDQRAFWLLLGLLGLLLVLANLLERSPVVREAIAVRDRPLVAASAGLPAVRIRTSLLVLGSSIAGLAGALLVHWRGSVVTEQFGVDLGLAIFLMLILGGMRSKYGALLGAWFYVYVEHGLGDLDDKVEMLEGGSLHRLFTFAEELDRYWPIVYGALLVVVMIALPDGLIGIGSRLGRHLPAGGRSLSALSSRSSLSSRFDRRRWLGHRFGSRSVAVPSRPPPPPVRDEDDAGTGPVLRAQGIAVAFGGVRAVDGVDLQVAAGEILGLIGPNGSGKSTLLNAISGVVPAEGSLEVVGRPRPLARPQRSRRAGIARTYQTPQTFTALTCLENVLLGTADRRRTGVAASVVARPAVLGDERGRWAAAQAALERVGLPDHAERPAAGLPYRDQRLLELARALVGQPRVLLLDEPSAGLNAAETDALAELLRSIRADGVSLLVVDHKIDFITTLCDRVVVLELGRLVAEGDPQAIWTDQRVVDVYLGVPADSDEAGMAEATAADQAVPDAVVEAE